MQSRDSKACIQFGSTELIPKCIFGEILGLEHFKDFTAALNNSRRTEWTASILCLHSFTGNVQMGLSV